MPTDPLWQRVLGLSTPMLYELGLPHAHEVYRKACTDGALWGLIQRDDRGWTLVLTHTTTTATTEPPIPGRLPTLVECLAARRQLLPPRPLMVVLLDRATQVLLTRMHASRPGIMPQGSGLPTTVRCVEMHIEPVTDDCVD